MILYHYTSLLKLGITKTGDYTLAEQWPDGILPQQGNYKNSSIDLGEPVIWLTSDPNPGGGKCGQVPRITVKIPSTDRKLVCFHKWNLVCVNGQPVRNQDTIAAIRGHVTPQHRAGLRYWYCCRGAVPASLFCGWELLDEHPWFFVDDDEPQPASHEAAA